jgi:hypothetical protein
MDNFKQDNYQILIAKLDEFIRKYYLNNTIRGSLYFIGLSLILFLAFSLMEYYFYFSIPVRKVMFYGFIAMAMGGISYWIFLPLLHYFRLGSLISHEQAARIIGQHFTDVDDKLLNVLQLKQQSFNLEQRELIEASINQKSHVLSPLPFKSAIDLSQNKKYLRYALPPLILLLGILLISPNLISESSGRIIQNNTAFEKQAPFKFIIENEQLAVPQNEDFLLAVNLEGSAFPNDVFLVFGEYQYRLQKNDPSSFSYLFKNVSKDTEFRFYAAGFYSKPYTLELLKKPVVSNFSLRLVYPAYTQLKPDELQNVGDINLPIGTRAEWVFQTENTSDLAMRFDESGNAIAAEQIGKNQYSLKKQVLKAEQYLILLENSSTKIKDSLSYRLNIIGDQYPEIAVESFKDSLSKDKVIYFAGSASDDYGIRSIHFKYQIHKYQSRPLAEQSILISSAAGKKTDYKYIWDYSSIQLEPGDRIIYYFEVGDNDGINGSKYARTPVMNMERPTLEEIDALTEKNNTDIKENLSKTMTEAKKLQQEIKQLRDKLLQQKDMDWQRKKDLEKLLEKQKQLEELLKETKDKFKENKENIEENHQPDERFQEKQEKLEEIFERVVDPETQQLMDKIQEMMKELNKENALQLMDEMQNKNKEKEMELDRLMELFKTLEVEYNIKKQAEALMELSKEQDKAAEKTDNDKSNQENLEKEQNDLNEKFEELNNKMNETLEKNSELERPKKLDDIKQEMDNIKKDMDKAKDDLKSKNNKNAKQRQKDAAKKMKELAEKMGSMMDGDEMDQMEEDLAALRQLLDNILTLSFKQEDLIQEFSRVNSNTPGYVRLVQDQAKIRDNFKMVEDSLHALSKRVFQLESFITEKTLAINNNISSSLSKLEDRKKTEAGDNQQRTMKNLNDLALMLNETMEQMQQAMSNMMPGTQMCKKPGQKPGEKPGSKPMDKITEGQKGVTEDMKKMKEGKESGKMGDGEQSKQFAEIAAKQAALKKALEQLQKEKQERGKGDKSLQEIIDQMNKNEIDLVNKRLTNEMMKRQQDILSRLLEAEKAEREQDWDDKRKAERPGDIARSIPPAMEEYLKKRIAETENYKTIPASVNPFYKTLIEQYYNALEN